LLKKGLKGNLHPSIEISNSLVSVFHPLIEIPNDAPVVACGHRILCAAAALHAHGITDIKNHLDLLWLWSGVVNSP